MHFSQVFSQVNVNWFSCQGSGAFWQLNPASEWDVMLVFWQRLTDWWMDTTNPKLLDLLPKLVYFLLFSPSSSTRVFSCEARFEVSPSLWRREAFSVFPLTLCSPYLVCSEGCCGLILRRCPDHLEHLLLLWVHTHTILLPSCLSGMPSHAFPSPKISLNMFPPVFHLPRGGGGVGVTQ